MKPRDDKKHDEPVDTHRRHPRLDETDPRRKEYREHDAGAIDPHRKDEVKPRD